MTILGHGLLAVVIALLAAPGARAACTSAQCSDEAGITAVRALVAARCGCSEVKKHKQYVSCARQVIKGAKGLSRRCKKTVAQCEARSTCGVHNAAVCCTRKGSAVQARMMKKGHRCGGATCSGAMALADACTAQATCAATRSVGPFSSVQQVFSQSCALPSCHSAFARQGGLVLESEDVSYESLVGHGATHPEAKSAGLLRVKPGDPVDSFLIRKLRGRGPGDPMP